MTTDLEDTYRCLALEQPPAEKYDRGMAELRTRRAATASNALSDAEEARFAGILDHCWARMSPPERDEAEVRWSRAPADPGSSQDTAKNPDAVGAEPA